MQANQYILLTSTEPYLEAVPQFLLLLCLAISDNVNVNKQPLFLLTVFTSVLSSVMGMAKFLMKGPCIIIPNTSGFLDGFLSFGFPPLFFSIFTTLFWKSSNITCCGTQWIRLPYGRKSNHFESLHVDGIQRTPPVCLCK